MADVLIAPTYRDINDPVIFLAGPIQGAPDWQREAIALLEPTPGIQVASPRRSKSRPKDFDDEMYRAQVDWEHHYLDRAADEGVILFWLAREQTHRCDRAYAQTTRFELGEMTARHCQSGVRMVVGVDDGFSNARYIRYTLSKKAPGIPVLDSLSAACAQAVVIALDCKP